MGAGLGWSWVVGSGGLGCCLLVVSEGTSLGGVELGLGCKGQVSALRVGGTGRDRRCGVLRWCDGRDHILGVGEQRGRWLRDEKIVQI